MDSTVLSSSGFGTVVQFLIATAIGCPTSVPQPTFIQIEKYQWRPPLVTTAAQPDLVTESALAALYAEAAEEDRALAAEGAAAWSRDLDDLDRRG